MKYNCASDIDAMGYDRVIENDSAGYSYLMRLDPSRYNPESSTPAEDQPIWQIKKVTEVSNSSGEVVTEIKFANGVDGFCHKASEAKNYTYKYRED